MTDLRDGVARPSTAGLQAGPVRERDPPPAAGSDAAKKTGVGGQAAGVQAEVGEGGDSPQHSLPPNRVP